MLIKSSALLLLLGSLCCLTASAQDTAKVNSSDSLSPSISWSGFIDAYFNYDFNNPSSKNIPFAFNHSRHSEFTANLALFRGNYSAQRVRANLGLMSGTYPQFNYATEPTIFSFLYDANVGYRFAKGLWLDAGIFGSSHIGFESAVSAECWTLTRSLCAENTPYYISGAKLAWDITDKLHLAGLVLNGWQRIQDNNLSEAIGMQIIWKPSENLTVNYSNFLGNEQPTAADPRLRFFNDFHVKWQATERFGLIVGYDMGLEGNTDTKGSDLWYNPTLIGRFLFNNQWRMAGRVEYYSDPAGVIVPTGTPNNFQTFGYSLNLDYQPQENIWLRLEARALHSKDAVFVTLDNSMVQYSPRLTASMAVLIH